MGSKYLLLKGAAGLGNRIFALLSAILYARLTRRQLVVDWSDGSYSSDGSNAIHHFFRSSLFSPCDRVPETESVEPAIWRGRLHERAMTLAKAEAPGLKEDPFIWRRSSIDVSRLDYQQDVLVMWSFFPVIDQMRMHLQGEFSGLRDRDTDAILRALMSEHLELQPAIQSRIQATRKKWPAKPTIGAHVRHTDRRTAAHWVVRRVDQLRSQHPGAQIFLATDNRAIELLFAQTYPGVLTAPKWYPKAGEKLHESADCPDKTVNGMEALVDVYLLAGCDYLVVDRRSSLSRLAGILADKKYTQVCDIRSPLVPQRVRDLAWLTRQTIRWGPRRFLAARK
jgi:hypothetical protein